MNVLFINTKLVNYRYLLVYVGRILLCPYVDVNDI